MSPQLHSEIISALEQFDYKAFSVAESLLGVKIAKQHDASFFYPKCGGTPDMIWL